MKKFIKLFILPAAIATTVFTSSAIAQQNTKKKMDKQKKVIVQKKKVDHSKKFFVDLKITNGHLGKVIIGCHEKATDKLDKKLDDMAPPPGMQTGYTVLVSPDRKYYLYRDVRGFSNEITWYFRATLNNKKFIQIQWDKKQFPKEYNFYLNDGTNPDIDMRKVSSQRITKESVWMIIAEKKKTAKADKKTP